MRKLLGVLLLAMMPLSAQAAETLKETSGTFDVKDVGPLLSRLSKLIDSGFGPSECDAIAMLATAMKPDDEQSRELTIKIQLAAGPRESTELTFATDPGLSSRIGQEMAKFADELAAR